MDGRNLLDDDGWPVIADRDRLPLVWLMEGAGRTAEFEKRLRDVASYSCTKTLRQEIRQEREAVAYALKLPPCWHFMKSRRFSDGKQMKSTLGMGHGQSGSPSTDDRPPEPFLHIHNTNISHYGTHRGYSELKAVFKPKPAAK